MHNTLDQLLERYRSKSVADYKMALREIMQSLVLIGLSRGGFFLQSSFYGGTALRIFYELKRYSEDLDFTLLSPDAEFTLEKYLPFVIDTMSSYGIAVTINVVKKERDSPVESAFAKLNTYQTFLSLRIDSEVTTHLHKDETMKIKFEVDKTPALGFNVESKWIVAPEMALISVLDLPSLFAGKLHAVLCRSYKNAVKGRDYYDFVFYVLKKVSPNLLYLKNKLIDSGMINSTDHFGIDTLKQMLHKKFLTVDFKEVANDASRFVIEPTDLRVYNADLFNSLVDEIT